MGMGFQFEQHRVGLWDLSWDLKKNHFLGNGIRAPPPPPFMTPLSGRRGMVHYTHNYFTGEGHIFQQNILREGRDFAFMLV